MKYYYRLTDAIIQVLLLAVWLVAYFTSLGLVINMYFITGIWCFISLLVHNEISSQKYRTTYSTFLIASIALIVIALTGFWQPLVFIIEGYLLLYIAPFFVLLYVINCIAEIRYLHKRPVNYLT